VDVASRMATALPRSLVHVRVGREAALARGEGSACCRAQQSL